MSFPRQIVGRSARAIMLVSVVGVGAAMAQQGSAPDDVLPVNLPTVLRLADERNRDIALFLARIDEASARLALARTAAIPTLRVGSTYDRHSGNLQETSGLVVDVDRASRFTGIGAGVSVDLADALFRPLVARQVRGSAVAAATANRHQVLAQVAVAYLRLVQARAEQRAIADALERAADLAALTADYAESGEGLRSDAEMAAVQPLLLRQRAAESGGRVAAASADLARLLHLEPAVQPEPLDEEVPLLAIFSGNEDVDALIARALDSRPEGAQLDALVGAAEAELTAERLGLFVPSVSLNYSAGEFGGAPGSSVRNTDHRDDLSLTLYWQFEGAGFGNRARKNERQAQLRQAGLQRERLRDEIVAEVRGAHARVQSASAQVPLAAAAIERARAAYELNRSRIFDRQGLPLEALAAMQALAQAELIEIETLVGYSVAQIRLHTALGNPIDTY